MIFIEDDGFQSQCKGLLDDEELCGLMEWLAARPDAGKADDKILLLDIYSKGKQEDLSADEIEKLKRKTMP